MDGRDTDNNNDDEKNENDDENDKEWLTMVAREKGNRGIENDIIRSGVVQGLVEGTPGEIFTGGPP